MASSVKIPLPLIKRVAFSRENFYIHSGVEEIWSFLTSQAKALTPFSALIKGEEKSGKTHFATALEEEIKKNAPSLNTIFFSSGTALKSFITENSLSFLKENTYIIVDNLEELFPSTASNLTPFESTFVTFFEESKKRKSSLVFFTSPNINLLPLSPHVTSRLNSMHQFLINEPEEEEFKKLLYYLARQRGIAFSPYQIKIISARLGKSLSSAQEFFNTYLYIKSVIPQKSSHKLLHSTLKSITSTLNHKKRETL